MIHNIMVQRGKEMCLVYSTNDNESFENFACNLLNAYDGVRQKYEHKYVKTNNVETIFFILE